LFLSRWKLAHFEHMVCSTSNNIGIVARNGFLWLMNLQRSGGWNHRVADTLSRTFRNYVGGRTTRLQTRS